MKAEDAQLIDLNDWILSGGGIQGESYIHRTDETVLLKLFTELFAQETVLKEIKLFQAIRDAGVPCPEPVKFVRVGDRYGIIYQRILDKKSFCKAVGEDPSMTVPLAGRLASMALALHSKTAEGTAFKSILDYYEELLATNTTIGPKFRAKLEQTLAYLRKDDRKTLLHGDFHFGNVITDGKKDYFIDLGTFSYGNPDFDNSILYYLCFMAPEFMLEREYHMGRSTAISFWNEYKKAYYGADGPSDAELKRRFLPYILIRTLFFEASKGAEKILDDIREELLKEMPF